MKFRATAVLALLLAVTACHSKTEPTQAALGPTASTATDLPHERAEPVAWDEVQNAFTFGGKPLTAGELWKFDEGTQGFYGTPIVTFDPLDGTHIVNNLTDAQLRSPKGLGLDGSTYNLVLVRLSRLAGGPPWDGSLFWITDAHDASESFQARPFLGDAPALNETVIMAYDMTRPRKGGDDWLKSVIQQLRLDTDDGAGGKFLLREIAVVQNPTPEWLHVPADAPRAAPR